MPLASPNPDVPLQGWRLRLYTTIFEADTRAGRLFDVTLIVAILLSISVVVADSVPALHDRWQRQFTWAEWGFTALFTIEYLARLACTRRPLRYALICIFEPTRPLYISYAVSCSQKKTHKTHFPLIHQSHPTNTRSLT